MALISDSVTGKLATSALTRSGTFKSDSTDLSSIPSFADILDLSQAQPSTSSTTETMTDWDIKALTRSGKSPQEVADAFINAGVTIYDVARATGSHVQELRNLAAELGMDYLDPYKDNPNLASAMDKLSDNAGGFVRIGVDANGKLHLQTAGSGGIFGWQNMDQIRMSDNSFPNLVQTSPGSAALFRQDLLNQQEVLALLPYLPQLSDTTVQYSTGGYPTAWSQREWNTGRAQAAYLAMQAESDRSGVDQKA